MMSVPGDTVGGYLRLLAKDPNTRVRTSRGDMITLQKPGQVTTLTVPPGNDIFLTAEDNKQILVVYFTASGIDDLVTVAPSALLLPPMLQWKDSYQFSTLPVLEFTQTHEVGTAIILPCCTYKSEPT